MSAKAAKVTQNGTSMTYGAAAKRIFIMTNLLWLLLNTTVEGNRPPRPPVLSDLLFSFLKNAAFQERMGSDFYRDVLDAVLY